MSSMLSNAFGASQTRKAGHKAKRDQETYDKKMWVTITDFMSAWEGTPPSGYQSWDAYYKSGKSNLGWLPGVKKKDWRQQQKLYELRENGLSPRDMVELSRLETVGQQEKFLSEKLGTSVKLNKLYKTSDGMIDAVLPKATAKEGTFEALDEIRAAGGKPSMEQQYLPWIKPGQDAYETLSNVILEGDMSGFYTSPGYAFRLAEGEKAITRLANAGKIPTAQANKGLVEYGQGLASEEFDKYTGRLSSLSQFGYGALQDLKSLESYYKGSEASMRAGTAANSLAMDNYQGQLMISGGQMGGSAIGSALQSIAGGVMSGIGNMNAMKDSSGNAMEGTSNFGNFMKGFGKGMLGSSSYG